MRHVYSTLCHRLGIENICILPDHMQIFKHHRYPLFIEFGGNIISFHPFSFYFIDVQPFSLYDTIAYVLNKSIETDTIEFLPLAGMKSVRELVVIRTYWTRLLFIYLFNPNLNGLSTGICTSFVSKTLCFHGDRMDGWAAEARAGVLPLLGFAHDPHVHIACHHPYRQHWRHSQARGFQWVWTPFGTPRRFLRKLFSESTEMAELLRLYQNMTFWNAKTPLIYRLLIQWCVPMHMP